MTETTPNAELAYRILDHIDAHPEQWLQDRWAGRGGTVGCFGGWAVMLSGYTVDSKAAICASPADKENLLGYRVKDASDRLLSISDETARDYGDPYDGFLTRSELGQLVTEIFGPRPGGAR
jgi:hypothetical protein